MSLIARGGSLLVGSDGKLTTNEDCCCDPCLDLVACECYNADGSVGTVPNATITISGTLVNSGVFGGLPSSCLPATLTDLDLDFSVEVPCDTGFTFRVFGPVICIIGGAFRGLALEIQVSNSGNAAGARLIAILGDWSGAASPQPLPGVVYQFGVDPEALPTFPVRQGTTVGYLATAPDRDECSQFYKPYCTPLGSLVTTVELDNSAINACWNIPASSLSVSVTR